MNTHELHLNSASFESIAKRRKTIECRLLDEKRKSINIGDELVFINTYDKTQSIRALVIALHYADTFHQLFLNESLLPKFATTDITTLDQDVNKIYSLARQQELSVVGIEFRLV